MDFSKILKDMLGKDISETSVEEFTQKISKIEKPQPKDLAPLYSENITLMEMHSEYGVTHVRFESSHNCAGCSALNGSYLNTLDADMINKYIFCPHKWVPVTSWRTKFGECDLPEELPAGAKVIAFSELAKYRDNFLPPIEDDNDGFPDFLLKSNST